MANKNKEATNGKRTKKASVNESGNLTYAWICTGVILLFTYIVFSPSMQNYFTNWDDGDYVINNPLVAANSVNIKEIFTTPGLGNYHPLTILTLAWNYQNDKLNAVGYHEENVLFHLFNTILVFFFVFLLTKRNLLMASIVALFFGIHPMHVESVTWVSERKDVLYVFFFLAGLITYLRYKDSGKILWYIFTLALFILSCLSKGMAVVFPVILLLVDYFLGVKWILKILIEKIPFFIIAIGFGMAAIKFQTTIGYIYLNAYTLPQRMAFACYSAIMYGLKLFAPVNLSVFYPYPDLDKSGNIPAPFYLFPVILLGIIALVYFFLRKEKPVMFGLLFYFVSIVLVLQFVTVGKQIMADRYSYLSYIGLLFALAYFIDKVWRAQTGKLHSLKKPIAAVLVAGAIIFSCETYARTQVWKNSITLWTDQIEKYPDNYYAYENLGNYYAGTGASTKAIQDYDKTLALRPVDFEAYCNRATVYKSLGKYDLALADYNKSIALDSSNWITFFNRGQCYGAIGQYKNALGSFSKCTRLNPNDDRIYNARGQIFLDLNKNDNALSDFSKAIELNPANADNWLSRSRAEFALDKKAEAKADAIKAQELGGKVDRRYLESLESI